jgi:hypothetical protein
MFSSYLERCSIDKAQKSSQNLLHFAYMKEHQWASKRVTMQATCNTEVVEFEG